MSYIVDQPIPTIITIENFLGFGQDGLTAGDFTTIEAFGLGDPDTLVPVTFHELDEGQYILTFNPITEDTWAVHYIYDNGPVHDDKTFTYQVLLTGPTVVNMTGGTWTYSGDLTDPSQEVRFLIQDTDGDYPIFTDSEVGYALGKSSDITRKAAAFLIQRLMARFAAMADTTELDLSVRASQMYDHYKDLLAVINSPFAANASVVPYAGGISHADIAGNLANTDRRAGIFDRNSLVYWRYR